MSEYRKLTCEAVENGDYVTIGDTEESGFRLYNGAIGFPANFFSYSIYRNDSEVKEKRIKRLEELGVCDIRRSEGFIGMTIFVMDDQLGRIVELMELQERLDNT